jgi:hypothetical protein
MNGTHGTGEQAIYLMVRAMLREKWGRPTPRPVLRIVGGTEVKLTPANRKAEDTEVKP